MRGAIAFLFLVAVPARADDLFSHCKISELISDHRRIKCADFNANVSNEIPEAGTESTLDSLCRPPIQGTRAEIVIAGVKRRGLHFVDGGRPGTMAAVPSSPGKIRVLACDSAKPGTCDRVLGALAASLPAVNTNTPAPNGLLAGRAVATPDGCSRPAPHKLNCPDRSLLWLNLPDNGETFDFDLLWNSIRQDMLKGLTLSESRRPCAIDGVDTECRFLAIQERDGMRSTVVAAAPIVRGTRVFVECIVDRAIVATETTVCAPLLALRQQRAQGQDVATNEKLMEQRLLDARAAYVNGQFSEAIRIARSALGKPREAWRMIGASSCFLKDRQQALEAWKSLDPDGQFFVELTCANNLITLPVASSAPGGATIVPAITLARQQVSHPDPHLPLDVRRAHPGENLVGLYLVCLNKDGTVSSVKSLSTLPRLDPAVDDGVMEHIRTQWRYQPQPVRVCFSNRIVFQIDGARPSPPPSPPRSTP